MAVATAEQMAKYRWQNMIMPLCVCDGGGGGLNFDFVLVGCSVGMGELDYLSDICPIWRNNT
jgi:hypothetical protein